MNQRLKHLKKHNEKDFIKFIECIGDNKLMDYQKNLIKAIINLNRVPENLLGRRFIAYPITENNQWRVNQTKTTSE